MALIVCKECGKKISDTSERCIHCGAMTADSIPVEEPKPQEEVVQAAPAPEAPPALKDYYKFMDETRMQLELDFLQQDAWAEKYRSKGLELKAFKMTFGISTGLLCFFVSMYLLYLRVAFSIFNEEFRNMTTLWVAIVGVVSCIAIFSILIKIFSKLSDRYERSHDKLVYLKKFQRWLRTEKNITLNPLFDNLAQRDYFENINLDNLEPKYRR